MAPPLPEYIANKLAEQTFNDFDDFSHAFWLAIAEDPIYPQQFVTAQLNRIKQGWPSRLLLPDRQNQKFACDINPYHYGEKP
ncbi:S-type pyocin [Pseudomonas faucium]|uniref:S-type pyocin n=1 Tax=Pseudomonas faucium TaxID=2740518 RepID=UPI001F3DECBF|nr:S-type pyocin [Pseudomonas faucium]